MAFCSKFGGHLRQNLCKNRASLNPAPTMHMLDSLRCMSTKLFIGNLSYMTDDEKLRDSFKSFGEVTEARVITDRDTGRSRGFGFVNFTTDESASQAMSSMDGQELNGRNIRVSYANERPSGGGFRGGGYAGGDGY